jgi:hypothetical protein
MRRCPQTMKKSPKCRPAGSTLSVALLSLTQTSTRLKIQGGKKLLRRRRGSRRARELRRALAHGERRPRQAIDNFVTDA